MPWGTKLKLFENKCRYNAATDKKPTKSFVLPNSPHPRKSLLLKGLVQKWTLWESNRNCHWFISWVFKKRGTCGRVDNLFTGAGTLIYGQTRPSGCCKTCHIVGTRAQWTGCAWPRCAGRGWCGNGCHFGVKQFLYQNSARVYWTAPECVLHFSNVGIFHSYF